MRNISFSLTHGFRKAFKLFVVDCFSSWQFIVNALLLYEYYSFWLHDPLWSNQISRNHITKKHNMSRNIFKNALDFWHICYAGDAIVMLLMPLCHKYFPFLNDIRYIGTCFSQVLQRVFLQQRANWFHP